jgi:hypothetical protein
VTGKKFYFVLPDIACLYKLDLRKPFKVNINVHFFYSIFTFSVSPPFQFFFAAHLFAFFFDPAPIPTAFLSPSCSISQRVLSSLVCYCSFRSVFFCSKAAIFDLKKIPAATLSEQPNSLTELSVSVVRAVVDG